MVLRASGIVFAYSAFAGMFGSSCPPRSYANRLLPTHCHRRQPHGVAPEVFSAHEGALQSRDWLRRQSRAAYDRNICDVLSHFRLSISTSTMSDIIIAMPLLPPIKLNTLLLPRGLRRSLSLHARLPAELESDDVIHSIPMLRHLTMEHTTYA
ncbi:hypothetical protein B0J11DRAFT_157381 [Dendryphion nanum]|uniref:Uncharacterized protein n=1 Tax=Dendryphion nanum TaxID=256645 RepID=A0A9P9EDW8_9PLEO|nr:hypothetical protein B0J11DRAFT_157381 [Dendryphion nanum]